MSASDASEADLQEIIAEFFPSESLQDGPLWFKPGDLSRIATTPAAGVQGELWRILGLHPLTRPIRDAWAACHPTSPCRTTPCTRCNGPQGIVQHEARRQVRHLFDGVPRAELQVITFHIEPVLIDTESKEIGADHLARRMRATHAMMIKRIQRRAPGARVFCAIEAEPKRVRDVPGGIYPNRNWSMSFDPDDVVGLIHAHAVAWDPSGEVHAAFSPSRRQRLGPRQRWIASFRPVPAGVAIDGDGVGYAAGYGLKRRMGWDFGRQTEAVLLVWEKAYFDLRVSGLKFCAGGRRLTDHKVLDRLQHPDPGASVRNEHAHRCDSGDDLHDEIPGEKKQNQRHDVEAYREQTVFDSTSSFTFQINGLAREVSTNRARDPPGSATCRAYGCAHCIGWIRYNACSASHPHSCKRSALLTQCVCITFARERRP